MPRRKSGLPRHPYRSSCLSCRSRRIKCGREKPVCINCVTLGEYCVFEGPWSLREHEARLDRDWLQRHRHLYWPRKLAHREKPVFIVAHAAEKVQAPTMAWAEETSTTHGNDRIDASGVQDTAAEAQPMAETHNGSIILPNWVFSYDYGYSSPVFEVGSPERKPVDDMPPPLLDNSVVAPSFSLEPAISAAAPASVTPYLKHDSRDASLGFDRSLWYRHWTHEVYNVIKG